jgi:2,5-dioxopentanoate dehydrogenase
MTGRSYVGFALSAETEKSFRSIDPKDNSLLYPDFYSCTLEEAERSVDLAFTAFETFSQLPWTERAFFLREIATQIENTKDKILERYTLESGLPRSRGEVEMTRTLRQLLLFAEEVESGNWTAASIDVADLTSNPPKPDLRKSSTGIGPVVVFGASNFPLAYSTAGGDTASALAAGCPVIVKAHPMHPGTSELVASAIIRAAQRTGMPEGVFSHLQDDGFEIGKFLVLHPKVKAVGFTGSVRGGRALFDLANSRVEPIPVFAEMGSVNPVIVLSGAQKTQGDLAAKLVHSVSSGAGQFCTKPGLIFLQRGEWTEQFLDEVEREILSKAGELMLGPGIFSRFESARKRAISSNGELLGENEVSSINRPYPSVLKVSSNEFLRNPDLHEEVFGPFSIIVQCDSIEDIRRCTELLGGQLTASVFCSDEETAMLSGLLQLLRTKVGRVIFNGVPTGVTVCPSMQHGGCYPSTTDSRFTAVGIDAMKRFLRPVTYQNLPEELLPEELKDANPLNVLRRVNGEYTRQSLVHKNP